MESQSIINTINNKYKNLLIEIEKMYDNCLTNKTNGLIVKIDVEPLSLSSEHSFLIKGQDFFRVKDIEQAVEILNSLGFNDKNNEEIVRKAYFETFKEVDVNSPFFLGLYILEATIRQ
jgi:hypothetical protein